MAAVEGMGVISRTSAVRYARSDKTIEQIGEVAGPERELRKMPAEQSRGVPPRATPPLTECDLPAV
mgnify:CR=1 FL=1